MTVMQIFNPIKEISEQQQPRKDEQKRGGDFYQNTMGFSYLGLFSGTSLTGNMAYFGKMPYYFQKHGLSLKLERI